MTSLSQWLGKFFIKVFDTEKQEIKEEIEIKNTIMAGALDQLFKPLYGVSADIEVKYIALGTSTATVLTTQTQLGNEVFRVAYASRTTASDWKNTTNFVVLDTEAQVVIGEIGVFGGSTASATTNSGTMISRILWTYDKTASNIELQIQRTDQLQRA